MNTSYKYKVYVGGEEQFAVNSKKALSDALKKCFPNQPVTTRQIRALKPGQVKMLGVVTTCAPEYKLRGHDGNFYTLQPPDFYTGEICYQKFRYPLHLYDQYAKDTPHLYPPRVVNPLWTRKHALTVIVGA